MEYSPRVGVTGVARVMAKSNALKYIGFIGVTHFNCERYTGSKIDDACNTFGILGFSVEWCIR